MTGYRFGARSQLTLGAYPGTQAGVLSSSTTFQRDGFQDFEKDIPDLLNW